MSNNETSSSRPPTDDDIELSNRCNVQPTDDNDDDYYVYVAEDDLDNAHLDDADSDAADNGNINLNGE